MRVLRGRAEDIDADREATSELFEHTAETGAPGVRAWTPYRQIAFGRRDARAEGYERAREAAADRGYQTIERRVGGRAVAYTGSTVAFARTEPVGDERRIQERYARASADLQVALDGLGVEAGEGEPPDSFCPGSHSLQVSASADTDDGSEAGPDSGKIVGIAQRVTDEAALVAGVVIVRDRGAFTSVLEPVYAALGVPFDPGSVGSVAGPRNGDDAESETVARAIEDALVERASRAIAAATDDDGSVELGEIERREI